MSPDRARALELFAQRVKEINDRLLIHSWSPAALALTNEIEILDATDEKYGDRAARILYKVEGGWI